MLPGKMCGKPKCKMMPCVAILAKFTPEAPIRAEFDANPEVQRWRAARASTSGGAGSSRDNKSTVL